MRRPNVPSTPNAPLFGDLSRLPRPEFHHQHVWADYIELMALTNLDNAFSKADFLDLWAEQEDIDRSQEDDPETEEDKSTEDLRKQQDADNWFRVLKFRERKFGKYYPFRVCNGGNVLRASGSYSHKQKAYLFLLLCSSLSYIASRSQSNTLAASFERLSAEALKSCMPPDAIVCVFGTNKAETRFFSGNLFSRISQLAEHVNGRLLVDESEFSPRDSGDNGLDVVGWVPLDDKCPGLPVAFGQCACTPEWTVKQHSSSQQAWSNTIQLVAPLVNFAFIPYCFRTSGDGWFSSHHVQGSVLVDRPRFLFLLAPRIGILSTMPAQSLVDAAVSFKRGLY